MPRFSPSTEIHRAMATLLAVELIFLPVPARALDTDDSTVLHARFSTGLIDPGRIEIPQDSSGAYRTTIPLIVPPARGEAQPNLSLDYSSDAGNGPLGVGWSLPVSSIRRSLREGVPAYDDNLDRFELDGQFLVKDLATGHYDTEQRRFLQVEYDGVENTWTIHRRDGMELRYGSDDPNARIENPLTTGPNPTFEWKLTRVTDRNGNNYRISYIRDSGFAYPSAYTYTFHNDGVTPVAATRSIVFQWEDGRPDVVPSYLTGFEVRVAKRLAAIEATVGGIRARRYELDYSPSPDTSRSRLVAVADLGTLTDPADPAVRTWKIQYTATLVDPDSVVPPGAQRAWVAGSWTFPQPGGQPLAFVSSDNQDLGVRLADINGDGLVDLVRAIDGVREVYLNNGAGFDSAPTPDWTPPTDLVDQNNRSTGAVLLDLNRDGRVDVAKLLSRSQAASGDCATSVWTVPAGGRGMWLNEPEAPTGFTEVGLPADLTTEEGLTLQDSISEKVTGGNAQFADLTGDGRPELLTRHWAVVIGCAPSCDSPDLLELRVWNRTNLGGGAFTLAQQGPYASFSAQQDCSDDDSEDCQIRNAFVLTGIFNWDCILFTDPLLPPICDCLPAGELQQGLRLGKSLVDLNGDGLADFTSALRLQNGTGPVVEDFGSFLHDTVDYVPAAAWNLPVPAGTTNPLALSEPLVIGNVVFQADEGVRFVDLNLDGRADIVKASVEDGVTTVLAFLNVGSDLGTPGSAWSEISGWQVPTGWELVQDSRDVGVRIVDVDGDSIPDLIRAQEGVTPEVLFGAGTKPDLLARIDNPLGGSREITYGPAGPTLSPDLSSTRWVMRSLVTDDTVSPAWTVDFDYEEGVFDPVRRDFLGFGVVVASGPTVAGQPVPSFRETTTFFHTTPQLRRRVEGVETRDSVGTLLRMVEHQYVAQLSPTLYVDPVSGGNYTSPTGQLLAHRVSTETAQGPDLENSTEFRRRDQFFRYDSVGNLIRTRNEGRVTFPQEWFVEVRDFTESTERPNAWFLVGTHAEGEVPPIQTSRQRLFYYDGDPTPAGTSPAAPSNGNLTRVAEFTGTRWIETRFKYDDSNLGLLVERTDPLQRKTIWRYGPSPDGFPTSRSHDLSAIRTAEAADPSSGLFEIFDYVPSDPTGPPGLGLSYRITRASDDTGTETRRGYDAHGRLISEETGPLGAPLTNTVWDYSQFQAPSPSVAATVTASTTDSVLRTIRFDGFGRRIHETTQTPTGHRAMEFGYEPSGQIDFISQPFGVTDPSQSAPAGVPATRLTYDALSRVVVRENPDHSTVQVSHGGFSTLVIDEDGNETKFVRNDLGRLQSVSEADVSGSASATTISYVYDAAGNLLRIEQPGPITTAFGYDELGRVLSVDHPDRGLRQFAYDDAGNLIHELDPRGFVTVLDYDANDALNRIQTRSVGTCTPGAWVEEAGCSDIQSLQQVDGLTYDDPGSFGLGRIQTVSDPSSSRTFGYDEIGRTSAERVSFLGSGAPAELDLQFDYDGLGNLASLEYPDGEVVTYIYDSGLVTAVTSSDVPGGYVNDVTYDQRGFVELVRFADGSEEEFDYHSEEGSNPGDGTDRLKLLQIRAPGQVDLRDWTLEYRPSGDVSQILDGLNPSDPTQPGGNASFLYDTRHRLTEATGPFSAGAIGGAETIVYDHDDLGNFLTKGDETFTYDPAFPPHQPTVISGSVYGYDAAGNVTAGGGRTFGYDALGRLTSASKGTTSISYAYDFLGLRAKRDVNGGDTTWFVRRLYEVTGTGADVVHTKHIPLGSRIIASRSVVDPVLALSPPAQPVRGTPIDPRALVIAISLMYLIGVGGALAIGRRRRVPLRPQHVFAAGMGLVILIALSPVHAVAELDTDGDGVIDNFDNCSLIPNPDQADVDADGVGDVCDNCPFEPNNSGEDIQRDSNEDGRGDACECGNVDKNTTLNIFDALMIAQGTLTPPLVTITHPRACDVDANGTCDIFDANRVAQASLSPPLATIDQECAAATPPECSVVFYHADGLGSAVVTTSILCGEEEPIAVDQAADHLGETRYGPWGSSLRISGNMDGRFRFTGHEPEADLGIVYFGARWYDPKIGRFLQPDPVISDIKNTDAMNPYAYVGNRPTTRVDPVGLLSQAVDVTSSFGADDLFFLSPFETLEALGPGLPPELRDPPAPGPNPRPPSQGGDRLSSIDALRQFIGGSGEPLQMSFDEIDTSSVRPTDFPAVQRELGLGPRNATIPIDDRLPFATSGDQRLFLGDITLRLQGSLVLSRSGTFQFEGTLRSFDDRFDFNPARRGFFGELSAAVGSLIPGRPFIIEIRGSKPISQSGAFP